MRKLFILLMFTVSLFSAEAMAQTDDKEVTELKKKIEMTIRRLDMRIDKVNEDQGKSKNKEVTDGANEYKKKMEDNRAALQADLKKLPEVKKENWKDFVEEVTERLDKAKESAKPVVL